MRFHSIARGLLFASVSGSLIGCDSLTEREENVRIQLDSFNLIGTNNSPFARAFVTGNPACTASMTSLNTLLTTVDNYDDIEEYLETLDINQVEYRISNNNTAVDTVGSMQMTDPATDQLTTVASISIPANTNVTDWANLPFTDGGAAIVQHYMDDLNDNFLYCAEGTPNSSDLSMTLELRLDLTVTVDLL